MFMPLVDHPLLPLVSGSFDELPVDEERAGPDGGDQVGRVDHPLPVLAGSIQMKAMATPAARLSAPLAT